MPDEREMAEALTDAILALRDAEAAARTGALIAARYGGAIDGELDAYRDAIEKRVRAEYWSSIPDDNYINGILAGPQVRALVAAATAFDAFIQMVDSGMTVFPLDPEHEDSEPRVYERVLANLRTALKPFEGGTTMTDDELLEAAAEAYYHETWGPMPSWANAGEYDKEVVRRGQRAALEVFRREQGARDEALRELPLAVDAFLDASLTGVTDRAIGQLRDAYNAYQWRGRESIAAAPATEENTQ